jgi:hypothetical protein
MLAMSVLNLRGWTKVGWKYRYLQRQNVLRLSIQQRRPVDRVNSARLGKFTLYEHVIFRQKIKKITKATLGINHRP